MAYNTSVRFQAILRSSYFQRPDPFLQCLEKSYQTWNQKNLVGQKSDEFELDREKLDKYKINWMRRK
jgi:hypothetical protein